MQYKNFINWITDDADFEDGRNVNYPTESLRPHTAQIGDFWRVLIHKSHLRGNGPEEMTPKLLKQNLSCAGVWDGTWSATEYDKVKIRRQLCEKYTEFSLQINDTSTAESPKQFALLRANGETLLQPVTVQGNTNEAYAKAIKEFWEDYYFAKVFIMRDGNILKVRAFHNTNFLFKDEAVTVGLGEQTAGNTNTPMLTVSNVGNVSYPQRNSWKLTIADVEEGNIFRLGDVVYTVKSTDTVESVKAIFLGEASRYIVDSSLIIAVDAQKGSKQVVNRNKPTIRLDYVDTSGGNDRYLVSIGTDILNGNIFEITAPSTTKKRAIATSSDTPSTIAAQLVEISGYYEVATGTTPTEKAILGSLTQENFNEPIVELSDLEVLEPVTVNKYLVSVSQDIAPGNVFTCQGTKYTAQNGDTQDSIAKALGFSGNNVIVEAETMPIGFAAAGKVTYDLAEVRLVQQPVTRVSNQFIVEMDFSGLSEGVYNARLQLLDFNLFSNNIDVRAAHDETLMLEVADKGQVFDYDYAESGLTQRIRLPLHVHYPKTRTLENRAKKISGRYERTNTSIESVRELTTSAEEFDYHEVMAAWLKHSEVWIDGISYFTDGEYQQGSVANWQNTWNATQTLIENDDRNNKGKFVLSSYVPVAYGGIKLTDWYYGLVITLKNGEIEYVIRNAEAIIPAGEYQLEVWNDGDARKIGFGIEGFLVEGKVRVPSRSVARWKSWLRIESGLTAIIACERLTDDPYVTYEDSETESIVEITRFETQYGISHDYNDDYNDAHNT